MAPSVNGTAARSRCPRERPAEEGEAVEGALFHVTPTRQRCRRQSSVNEPLWTDSVAHIQRGMSYKSTVHFFFNFN